MPTARCRAMLDPRTTRLAIHGLAQPPATRQRITQCHRHDPAWLCTGDDRAAADRQAPPGNDCRTGGIRAVPGDLHHLSPHRTHLRFPWIRLDSPGLLRIADQSRGTGGAGHTHDPGDCRAGPASARFPPSRHRTLDVAGVVRRSRRAAAAPRGAGAGRCRSRARPPSAAPAAATRVRRPVAGSAGSRPGAPRTRP